MLCENNHFQEVDDVAESANSVQMLIKFHLKVN